MNTYRRARAGLAISIIVGLFIITSLFTASRIVYGATLTYTYDDLNRLTKVVYGNGAAEEFTYDPAGNRLTHLIRGPDTSAPTAAIGLTPTSGAGGWTNSSSFDISWTNPGDLSGIAAVWYKMGTPPGSNSDGTRVEGSNIGSLAGLVIPSEGETIFYLWLEDGAGNKDQNNRAEIMLRFDGTKPGLGTIAINNGAAYATSLLVNLNNLSAIDTLSGISKMRFSNNPGGPWSAAEAFTADRTGWDLSAWGGTASAGRKAVYVQYQDGAGNWSDSFFDEIVYQPLQGFPFFDDFSTDKGWVGYGPGQWERGPALTGGGSNGNPDPEADHTQTGDDHILGFAIGADYPDGLSEEVSIVSPAIDCSGRNPVVLKFWRYLNLESNLNDHARVYVSNNGTDWVPIWENPDSDLTDNAWTLMTLDISPTASDKPVVFIKFSMGPTNASRAFSGWNIDDVEVTSEAVYPIEGTLGTEFKVWAPDLGVKKGKVLIEGLAQKVLGWTNEWVKCRISKPGPLGICDLSVILGDKSSILFPDGFTVMPPHIESIAPPEGKPGEEVIIKGKFFGTKKGKVLLNYVAKGKAKTKSCKITDWYMNLETGESEIVFLVPAGIVAGTYPLKVINSVGEAAGEFTIVLP